MLHKTDTQNVSILYFDDHFILIVFYFLSLTLLCLVFFSTSLATPLIHKNIKSYYNDGEQLHSSSTISDKILLTACVHLCMYSMNICNYWYHAYILSIMNFLQGCLWVETRESSEKYKTFLTLAVFSTSTSNKRSRYTPSAVTIFLFFSSYATISIISAFSFQVASKRSNYLKTYACYKQICIVFTSKTVLWQHRNSVPYQPSQLHNIHY